jgi:hypothetical protein
MKTINRIIFFAGLTAILFAGNTSSLMAQNASTDSLDAKVEVARQISWNIMRLVGGLADHFSAFKGDSVSTLNNGVVCYKVKDIKDMNADNEFIMKKPGGDCYYVGYITGDDARIRLYEIAFVLGIDTFDANKDHALATSKDTVLSTNDKVVYNLTLKGTKVGSFSEDNAAKNAYIIIGFIK